MLSTQPITPCLWFDTEAEAAAQFWISIFPDSTLVSVSRYTEVGKDIHGKEAGRAMTVNFRLNHQPFMALNGGPIFTFTPAISFQVFCQDQQEIDHYWNHLSDGGEEHPCGWVKDRYGVSWQIIPAILPKLMASPNSAAVTEAFLQMKKFDLNVLCAAAGLK
jgi:predicted 3-demethylubiquinone-9 3-methyltransferase (glyoxalase superfamily)